MIQDKKIFLIILSVFILLNSTLFVFAEETVSNSGFVKGDIWFSADKLVEGDQVKIFTAVWNGGAESINGTVIFYDKDVVLGRKDFSIPAESLREVSIDWKVTAGDHSISASIVNSKVSNTKSEITEQFVPKSVAKKTDAEMKSDVVDFISDKAKAAGDFIKENTPESISKPVAEATQSVESWRKDTGSNLTSQAEETKKEIDNSKKTEKVSDSKTENKEISGTLSKWSQYAKLFFVRLGSFIFNQAWLFYALPVLVLILIIRLMRKKFKGEKSKYE